MESEWDMRRKPIQQCPENPVPEGGRPAVTRSRFIQWIVTQSLSPVPPELRLFIFRELQPEPRSCVFRLPPRQQLS
jgi:hypothetical protein